jgi:hypothetical protein
MFSVALAIRSISSPFPDAFIQFYSCPFQGFQDIFLCSGYESGLISVFYTKNKLSTKFAGKKKIV